MKTLKQVIEAVQYELGCSLSELSRKLGKSRNYLVTTVKTGLSNDKEQELINSLLGLVDDENWLLRRLLEDREETITAYKIKLKEIINENLSEIEKKNKTITDLEHRIVVLSRNVDKGWEEVNKLNEVVATKDLFIDGLDNDIKELDLKDKQLQDDVINLEVSKAKYNGALWLVSGLCLVLAVTLAVKL